MRRRKLIAVIAVLLFVAIGILLTIRINLKYPKAEEIFYNMNEDILFEDDIYIRVNSARLLSEKQKSEVHIRETESGLNFKSIAVSITITNIGNEEKTIEIYPKLVSGAFGNGSNLAGFKKLNGEQTGFLQTLEAGDIKTIQFPYLLFDFRFMAEIWENVENEPFSLVFSIYPQKKSIQLSLSE